MSKTEHPEIGDSDMMISPSTASGRPNFETIRHRGQEDTHRNALLATLVLQASATEQGTEGSNGFSTSQPSAGPVTHNIQLGQG